MRVNVLPGQKDITEHDLGDLQKQLKLAMDNLDEAERAESIARSNTTAARNHVNGIQKKIDAVVDGMRSGAPTDSDWGSARRARCSGS